MPRLVMPFLAAVVFVAAPMITLSTAPSEAGTMDSIVLRTGLGTGAALAAMQPDGALTVALPLGLLDRVGRTLYIAQPQSNGTTLVKVVDVATALTLRSTKISGSFSTYSGDYAEGSIPPQLFNGVAPASVPLFAQTGRLLAPKGRPADANLDASPVAVRLPSSARAGFPADGSQVLSALSFNARWLALRETRGSSTRIAVIDTQKMRVVTDTILDGQFGLDAITSNGKVLYLIQSLPDIGYGVYQVRSFSIDRHVLDNKIIVERGQKPGSMQGEAWTRQWSPDGSWLYTLYIEDNGQAFVHALNLNARTTACLDFPPVSSNVALMAHFTLSVAPNGKTLYAINTVLGVAVAVENLPAGTMRLRHLGMRAGAPVRTQAAAAIAADGRSVFVATGSGVWVIDTGKLDLKRSLVPDQEVASVALSHDGRHLYVLSPASGQLETLSPDTGSLINDMQPDADAWAIEGVS
jgi:hypothetical protein